MYVHKYSTYNILHTIYITSCRRSPWQLPHLTNSKLYRQGQYIILRLPQNEKLNETTPY